MAQREAQLEALFRRKVALGLGGMVVKLAPTLVGIPDRLVVLPLGRMFLVELKTETGRLSPIQRQVHERLAGLGVTVIVLHGATEIAEWVRAVAGEQDPKPKRPGRKPATRDLTEE